MSRNEDQRESKTGSEISADGAGPAARSTRSLYRKVSFHVAPFLILLYFVAFLDRVNISFASITMNRDSGIAEDLYGFAAGIFFVGYLVFTVPSNIMLSRLGARRWIAILITVWGILSCALAFVRGPIGYVVVRFLIGAAEAGFFPGLILYLTRWLPGPARAGILALFTLSIPISNIVGAPLSVWILSLGGRGDLRGWQWLFLLEGLPAVLLGLVVPFALASGPEAVKWLSEDERHRLLGLLGELDGEAARRANPRTPAAMAPPAKSLAGLPPEVVPAGIVYFCLMIGLYALGFWIPKILLAHDITFSRLGWLTAIPFLVGGAGMLFATRTVDRRQQTARLYLAFLVAAAGMALTGLTPSWPLALAGLSIAATGVLSGMPLFWADFSQRVSPAESAISIAAVNSVGNIGGFLGPYAIGWLLSRTHAFLGGLLMTSAFLLSGSIIVFFRRITNDTRGHA